MKKKTLIVAIPFLLVLLLYVSYIFSSSDLKTEVTMEINPGASFNSVLNELNKLNVITNKKLFKIYAAIRGDLKNIKPGEYRFDGSSTKKEILDAITQGNVVLYKITVPEGYNMYQVADIVNEELGVSRKSFLKEAKDPEVLKKWEIDGQSVEGYLYPETYFFAKGTTPEKIIEKMLGTFKNHYKEEITEKGKKLGLTKKEIIILASIIEKETGQASERRLISAVFHNRMKRNMKFQSDPTTIYGIFERYRGNLTKKDLLETTPYNTYRIKGMPVGPIANPGMESIEAAVNPEKVSYLYFVAKKDKTHVFANTLKEHNANVNQYQLNGRKVF